MSIASIRSEVRRMKARVSIADAFAALSNDERYRLMDRLFVGGTESGYIKHCELMARGIDCRSRLMIAANRVGKCLTYQTLIETDRGKISVGELFSQGREFNVVAWDGSRRVISRATAPFKKEGLHECFRIEMSDGSVIEAADHHRILLDDGATWGFAEEIYHRFHARETLIPQSFSRSLDGILSALMRSLSFFACRDQSSSELSLSAHGEDDRRSIQRRQDCSGCCSAGCHQCGEQPHAFPDIFQELIPSQGGALLRISASSCSDDSGNRCTYNPSQYAFLRSTPGVALQALDRFFGLLSRTACTTFQWLSYRLQAVRLLCAAAFDGLRLAHVPCRSAHGTFYCGSPSWLMPLLVDGNKIVSIKPIGRKEVYDFEVETFHNYVAGGLVHHNTVCGAYEAALHLTGKYPDWWDGMRFDRPIICWCAGDTAKTTREFVQAALLGDGIEYGTGTVPRGAIIGKPTTKSGVARAVDTFEVRHKTGGISTCVLKSYDQGEEAFMGKAVDFIWLDEEPPIRVVTECIIRTMTCNGRLLQTFTPIWGLTETVQHFMPSGSIPDPMPNGVHIVQASWEDAPHLTPEMRSELESHIPPFQRDARMRGIPALGSGAIYPIPESEIVVQPFEIPDYWPRAYGMDVGWNRTAAVWGARDPDSGTIYLYAEYYRGEAEPSVHAAAIRARGEWIPGVIDPAARGRGQADGRQLLQDYIDLGLNIDIANNAVEAGIYRGWEMMSAGRIKVFATLQNWISEYRIYRRDEKGRVVKERDHALDASRYLWMSGMDQAIAKPVAREKREPKPYRGEMGWM